MREALTLLHSGDYTCAAVLEREAALSKERGIRPLLEWLERTPCPLNGAYIADKVVGKAAALLFAFGRAAGVHAQVISEPAAGALDQLGIPYAYEKIVPHIINRKGDGICPMEQKAMPLSSPEEAFCILKETVRTLSSQGK